MPGIASTDNTMHATTARNSADVTKPNQTPTRYTLAKDTTILPMATPPSRTKSLQTRRTYTGGLKLKCGLAVLSVLHLHGP